MKDASKLTALVLGMGLTGCGGDAANTGQREPTPPVRYAQTVAVTMRARIVP